MTQLLIGLIYFIITAILVIIGILALVYVERRVLALFALRYGPNRVGYRGILQTLADALKLLQKEDSAPSKRRKILFFIAPFVVFCPILCAFCLIPSADFGTPEGFSPIAPTVTLILGLVSIPVIGTFLAGFSSNNKYALLGAMRSIIQVISAEIPIGISILAVTFMAGSLNLNEIIQAQSTSHGLFGWYFIPLFIGMAVFFVSSLALLNRTPFDLKDAASELVSGYNVEYSGIKFALFYMAEYALLILVSTVFVCLFFGGYLSPVGRFLLPAQIAPIEAVFWLFLKTFLVILFIILIRASLPRARYDRLLTFSYKILLPLALINLNIAVIIQYFAGIK